MKGVVEWGRGGGRGWKLKRGFTVYSFICYSWGAGTDAWGPGRDDVSNYLNLHIPRPQFSRKTGIITRTR